MAKLSRGSSLERDVLEGDNPVLEDNMLYSNRVESPR